VGLKLDRQGKLVLFGRAAGTDKPTEVAVTAVEVTGKPVTVLLNRLYLAKALRFGLTEIQIQDALSPVRCTDESGRQLIIMPIRLDGVTPQPAPAQPGSPAQKTAQASPTSGNNMQNENKNGQPATSSRDPNKTAIETAVEQLEAAKASIGTALTSLNGVVRTLRQAQREQRGTEKEIQSVRSTLQTLQRVKI
jgi:hypothetical protein